MTKMKFKPPEAFLWAVGAASMMTPAIGKAQTAAPRRDVSRAVVQERLSPFAPLLVSSNKNKRGDFQLVTSKGAVPLYVDATDFAVVRIAADALAGDIERVSGAKASVQSGTPVAGAGAVFVGTLGKSRLIDGLVANKQLDVAGLRGKWEQFVIATVDNPVPGVRQGLVIVGSDRRGTAYGAFSVSESIGVSPWVWWADVVPRHRDSLVVSQSIYSSKAPSVKYRGIFINDEDFGLQPWAAKTFEPESKDIGPKTYAKVCELLLRLKANYLCPAMHPSTRAFNSFAQNKVVADEYAIVMGSSHAEPMLRNNVGEWNEKTMGAFNYLTNRERVLNYWDERVKENGQYENLYTLGMRGIHDSSMEGGGTTAEKVARMEDIFAQQRAMLARHVNPDAAQVPQIFVPYKEVLPLYQAGLKVPDDVTLVWVDDNFGFIRQLSNAQERKRQGGSGVYYHFSYWGVPQDYLWLGSTSPALTAYEMGKAYAYGADRVWVFNVGDIKPIEKEMEFGLRLAYDVNRYPADKAMSFLDDWANENFGAQHAGKIAAVLKEYYRLARQVKPEHVNRVEFTFQEQGERGESYNSLMQQVEELYAQMPAEQKDAFFQLVLYPVECAGLMDRKRTYTVRGNADIALKAYDDIQQLTRRYNKEIAGGKWDNMMSASPRDTSVFQKPDAAKIAQAVAVQEAAPLFQLEAKEAQISGAMKREANGLVGTDPEVQTLGSDATARFTFDLPQAQKGTLYFLAQCLDDKHDSWFVSLNDQKTVSNDHVTGSGAKWLKVMDADLRAGKNELVVTQREPGAVIQKVALMALGTVPIQVEPRPSRVFAADNYSAIKNSATSQWKRIEGLGIEQRAMTLSPYLTAPIAEADMAKAPSISYSFPGSFSGCNVEARFVPTQRINEGMGLRYAVSVDGGPAQIRNINALEFAGDWAENVLRGYASGTTTHAVSATPSHTITIRLLDPGMVLSQVRVFGKPATP